MQYLYGPVASWRLGRSLGVDILSTADKTCSFECLYCELGRTVNKTTERKVFVPTDVIERELHALAPFVEETTDVITFAGMGEPALGANLSEVVAAIRRHTRKPIAILTNAALITDPEVRNDLKKLDIVVAKLDAPDQAIFDAVNRPVSAEIKLDEIIAGLTEFRREYRGRLCLQLMFIAENRASSAALTRIAVEIQADVVQLNTPLRPCGVAPLSAEEMQQIEKQFDQLKAGIEVVSVYKKLKPEVRVINKGALIRRRGAED
ncbi:MAG TPA: radical SAM protein [Methanomicrobia archaeon]|nr:radical SAM protein [Methanomicrobia archaeon]